MLCAPLGPLNQGLDDLDLSELLSSDDMAGLALMGRVLDELDGAPLKSLPLTVRPCVENLAALFSPMPLTRCIRSGQSLKLPLLRSFNILPDSEGPMPLRSSSSAALALFTSTAAKQDRDSSKKAAVNNFLNMLNPLIGTTPLVMQPRFKR